MIWLFALARATEPVTAWLPAEVTADFDGDGRLDRATQVKDSAGRIGVSFTLSSRPEAVLIGAGVPIGNGGDDLAWVERWTIRVDDRRAALLLESESGGGGVRWNGRKFVWRQFGD